MYFKIKSVDEIVLLKQIISVAVQENYNFNISSIIFFHVRFFGLIILLAQ